jgi:hypothetical protein
VKGAGAALFTMGETPKPPAQGCQGGRRRWGLDNVRAGPAFPGATARMFR